MAADETKDQEGEKIPWTEDAQALLKKVPFFIRKNVEKEAEDYARSHGMSRVEASVIVRIKASKSDRPGEGAKWRCPGARLKTVRRTTTPLLTLLRPPHPLPPPSPPPGLP